MRRNADTFDSDTSFVKLKLDSSKFSSLAKDEYIFEPISARGFTGEILCFPRGIGVRASNNGAYLSLGLVTHDKSRTVVKTIFHAFVVGRDGGLSSSRGSTSSSCELTCLPNHPVHDGIGAWDNFMKRSELESDYVVVDGCITFVCGVTVLLQQHNRISVPASDLGNHLADMLDSADGSDVAFSVGGETFRAHRAVLAARSPVFKAQLLGSMADAKLDRITLHDIKPATFRLLLRYMYTDALPVDEEINSSSSVELLQHLLTAADMYHLDRLKLLCAQKLSDRETVENVATMLACAETAICPELKNRCMEFFMAEQYLKKVVVTEGYLRLMQGFPSVVDEIREGLQT